LDLINLTSQYTPQEKKNLKSMEGPRCSVVFQGRSAKFLDALVDDCSEKLKSFLGEKVVSVFGVRSEFNKLQHKLKYIKSMLNDAKRRRIDDSVTQTWIDELIYAMHDADDIIDDFRSEFDKHSEDRASASTLNQIVSKLNLQSWLPAFISRYEINDKIITLNKKIDDINKNRQDFSIDVNQSKSPKNSKQTTSIIDADIVGRELENNTRKLIEVITRNYEQRKLCVIAIVGMGGIGKTTLAQNVYNDPLLRNSFQENIWVTVSKEYSAIDLLKDIIKKIDSNPSGAETICELHEKLASKINGKRFFLVLDDVWQSIVWTDLLKNPLQFASSGVILLTTRDKTVASRVGAIHIHEVEKLSRTSCWELLCKKAYIEEEDDMLNLREVGMGIVKKCDGLPLAIKVIGGLLADKNKDKREWEKVLQSNAWFKNDISEELYRALYISYEDLTPPLQNCFQYCSLYPEDYYMISEYLIKEWIAEGYIQQKEDELMEDVGEEYYNQLVRRNLLQPSKFLLGHEDLINIENQCQMHDIVRTFAHHLGQGAIYYGDPGLLTAGSARKLHHLTIHCNKDVVIIPGSNSDPLRLRTLGLARSPPILQCDIFPRTKYLRVLILNGRGIMNIPDSIGDLKHLRMLDLEFTSISMLPNSICSLIGLQFLLLQDCKSLQLLPQGITQLSNLRCLNLADTPLVSVPKGICKLKFLNDLKGFIVAGEKCSGDMPSGWHLDELEPLTELRCLRLDKLENAAMQSSILANKCHLKSLQLSCTSPHGVSGKNFSKEDCTNIEKTFDKLNPPVYLGSLIIWRFFGYCFPSWLGNLPYLTGLGLINCISCCRLPPLGQLQNLKCLRIKGACSIVSIGPEFMGTNMTGGTNITPCFPKLEILRIEEMPNWEEWSFSNQIPEKLFPSLLRIDIDDCPKLKALPKQLKHINCLQKLIIHGARSLKEIDSLTSCLERVYIGNSCCEKISNITGVRHLSLVGCSALRSVENNDMLQMQTLYIEDESMDYLPEWLLGFLDQQPSNGDIKLHFLCNIVLLRRCLQGCSDWPIIERFSHVRAFTKDNTAFLEYQKQPYRYHTNL
jgi:Leucine-rich repeat (LRR) protein